MINSEPDPAQRAGSQQGAVDEIVRGGALGAIVLAGIATAIVVAIWFAFYFLVFVPRAIVP